MIRRAISKKIIELRKKFPVLTLTGPRQSGKTTLLKSIYSDIPYVSLEDIDNRKFASEDPRGFLSNYPDGAVLDEIQNVPDLFSYIQGIVDDKNVHFALSGSQNFLVLDHITQSLAGRTAILNLLPLSLEEMNKSGIHFPDYASFIFNGMYPRIYDKKIQPQDFYPSYISSYVEKDVRSIKNIENLSSFIHFVELCAGRSGQLLNLQSLANDAGISPNTAKAWISVLEASYVIYLLKPYHKNYNKRIIKSPKIYFYDTGLLCSILGINNVEQVKTHYSIGALFENFVINEYIKVLFNKGLKKQCYFWQSKTKQEIDLLINHNNQLVPIEIKSGMTKQDSFLKNLKYWQKLTGDITNNLHVIYGGDDDFKTSKGNFLSWKNMDGFFDKHS